MSKAAARKLLQGVDAPDLDARERIALDRPSPSRASIRVLAAFRTNISVPEASGRVGRQAAQPAVERAEGRRNRVQLVDGPEPNRRERLAMNGRIQ